MLHWEGDAALRHLIRFCVIVQDVTLSVTCRPPLPVHRPGNIISCRIFKEWHSFMALINTQTSNAVVRLRSKLRIPSLRLYDGASLMDELTLWITKVAQPQVVGDRTKT